MPTEQEAGNIPNIQFIEQGNDRKFRPLPMSPKRYRLVIEGDTVHWWEGERPGQSTVVQWGVRMFRVVHSSDDGWLIVLRPIS